jgi:hypothetical protein
MNKISYLLLQQRFLQEFEAACLDRGFNDESVRIGKRDAVRLI